MNALPSRFVSSLHSLFVRSCLSYSFNSYTFSNEQVKCVRKRKHDRASHHVTLYSYQSLALAVRSVEVRLYPNRRTGMPTPRCASGTPRCTSRTRTPHPSSKLVEFGGNVNKTENMSRRPAFDFRWQFGYQRVRRRCIRVDIVLYSISVNLWSRNVEFNKNAPPPSTLSGFRKSVK
jgi:hypothetical protein